MKHKTGGRKPHLPRLISACVWLINPPTVQLAPANAPGRPTAHVQAGWQGAWGRGSTRKPLDCACTLQYLPGLSGFQVADQGHVPRDHQSHTDQSARQTGLGLRSTPCSAQARACLSSTRLSTYQGICLSGFWGYLITYLGRHLHAWVHTYLSGAGLGTIEVYPSRICHVTNPWYETSISRSGSGTAQPPLELQELLGTQLTKRGTRYHRPTSWQDRRSGFLCSLSRKS